MQNPSFKVPVTWHHIHNSVQGCDGNCAIAQAIKDTFPDACPEFKFLSVSVKVNSVTIETYGPLQTFEYVTSTGLEEWINIYDDDKQESWSITVTFFGDVATIDTKI